MSRIIYRKYEVNGFIYFATPSILEIIAIAFIDQIVHYKKWLARWQYILIITKFTY